MLQNQIIKLLENRLRRHQLPVAVELWNGQALRLSPQPNVTLKINNEKALFDLAKPSLGGLAKRYVEQSIDVVGRMRDIILFGDRLCAGDVATTKKSSRTRSWWKHSKPTDQKNISHHYDVSNAFYALWLDQRRVYSCAYFVQPDDTLDLAQAQKLDHICRKLNLKPNERLLDIGCGWGGLILWAAEHYQVRATGITLSQNQHDYVQEQIQARGLQDRVAVHLMDYRDVPEV